MWQMIARFEPVERDRLCLETRKLTAGVMRLITICYEILDLPLKVGDSAEKADPK